MSNSHDADDRRPNAADEEFDSFEADGEDFGDEEDFAPDLSQFFVTPAFSDLLSPYLGYEVRVSYSQPIRLTIVGPVDA